MLENQAKKQTESVFKEVALAYTPEEIAKLQAQYGETSLFNKEKTLVEGIVSDITERDVVLDLNAKANGIVSLTEFKDLPSLKVGDKVEVYIERQENRQGQLVVSRRKAKLLKAWQALEQAKETGKVVSGVVRRTVKGGLVLDVMELEVFMPGSQINTVQTTNFAQYVGQQLEVLVVKVDPKKDNIVVSRTKLIEKQQEKQREIIINSLEIGQVLTGVVKNITNFGLFINLGGVVGLLHKKDLNLPNRDLLQATDAEGKPLYQLEQELEVVVKDFDLEKNQISLSTKMLAWSHLSEDIVEGSRITGTIKEVAERYALVEVIPDVFGWLNIGDMSRSRRLKHAKEVVSEGQELEVEVLEIDRINQELRVGLKHLLENPWEGEEMANFAVHTRHKAQVVNTMKHGAYVELKPGISGFLSNRNLSWIKKDQAAQTLFEEGQEVEVIILDVDYEKNLLSLGVRELEKDPWPSFQQAYTIGSPHKGKVVRTIGNSKLVIELPTGLEAFMSTSELGKEGVKNVAVGDEIDVYISFFDPAEHKIALTKTPDNIRKDSAPKNYASQDSKATLGDFEALKRLRKELAEKNEDSKK
jgi:small subunit ribosomal protein S1